MTALKQADWPAVVDHCSQLLATRTTDLQLAVWLTEALAKTRGLAGLAQGYRLLARLCESYWGHIHPLPDDSDQELRAGNLAWLLARSVILIRELPLTLSPKGDYSGIDLDGARKLGQAVARRPG